MGGGGGILRVTLFFYLLYRVAQIEIVLQTKLSRKPNCPYVSIALSHRLHPEILLSKL